MITCFFSTELLKSKIDETTKALRAEFESERVHHQKLVKDYGRLQQRFENLHSSVQLHLPGGSSLSRSASNVSQLSIDSDGNVEKADTVSCSLSQLILSVFTSFRSSHCCVVFLWFAFLL